MPDKQWNDLQQIINGEMLDPLPVGVMGEEDFKKNIWTSNYERIIFSCGGEMPPGVSTDNIKAFYVAVCE